MAFTQAEDSIVHGRTVSVRPSRYRRVIDASYVNENFPESLYINTTCYIFPIYSKELQTYNTLTAKPSE